MNISSNSINHIVNFDTIAVETSTVTPMQIIETVTDSIEIGENNVLDRLLYLHDEYLGAAGSTTKILAIIHQYLFYPTLDVSPIIGNQSRKFFTPIVQERSSSFMPLTSITCPITHESFFDLVWSTSHRQSIPTCRYFIALTEDNLRFTAFHVNSLHQWFLQKKSDINPLNMQPIMKIHYFMTDGECHFTHWKSVSTPDTSVINYIAAYSSSPQSTEITQIRKSFLLDPQITRDEKNILLELIIADEPRNFEAHLERAKLTLQQGNFDHAVYELNETIQIAPDGNIDAHIVLADAWIYLKKDKNAKEILKNAYKINKKDINLLIKFNNLLIKLKDFKYAKQTTQEIIQLHTDPIQIVNTTIQLCTILIKLQEFNEAEQRLKQIIKKDTNNSTAKKLLENLLKHIEHLNNQTNNTQIALSTQNNNNQGTTIYSSQAEIDQENPIDQETIDILY